MSGDRCASEPEDLRPARLEDIPGVLALWRVAAPATSTDTAGALTALLARDPGALIVAEDAGRIVGSVIAAWDGWRGSIYRLAVAPGHRRRGLGRRLLGAGEAQLDRGGAQRMHAIVVETNERALAFWDSTSWEHQRGQLRYTRG